jgi:hypothetical protein
MLNSVPNNSKYQQGNFIPTNKDKVIKLNDKGGVYYRSSLELKMMTWLDNSPYVSKWCGECMTIPYQMTHYEKNGDIDVRTHTYYPDFYYELSLPDGNIKKMVIEVKPQKEYDHVVLLSENKLAPPDAKDNIKKWRRFEYDLKMAQKNKDKWEQMIKYCDKKGWEFKVVTESVLKKLLGNKI